MSTVQSLKESGLKATLPRRKILELFESSKVRHLSAEDVYKALIAEGIDIGLATVYRVLTQFEQAGLLSRRGVLRPRHRAPAERGRAATRLPAARALACAVRRLHQEGLPVPAGLN